SLEARGLGEASPLEAENRHCDLPAIARLPDEVAIVDLGPGEKDLAKLTTASHLLDPPDLDPGLVHVDQEKPDPAMRLGCRVGASNVTPRRPRMPGAPACAISSW